MSRIIDITGQKFGRLTVIKLDYQDEENKPHWICECECGKIKTIKGANLKSGSTISCGCYGREMVVKSRFINLKNQKFGKLTVIRHLEKSTWECLCECGNVIFVSSGKLRGGKTISCKDCGYKRVSEKNTKNLLGIRFGKLIVISLDHMSEKYGAYWKCECDCGNTTVVVSGSLLGNQTKSCGCLRESLMATELKRYFIDNYNAKKEKVLFKNPSTNQWLRCDIYIPHGENPDLNGFYIEINGEQHYRLNNWHKIRAKENKTIPEEEFKNQRHRDKLKKNFAKKNGAYIEIDLRKIKTTEQAIEYIEKILEKNLFYE